MSSAKWRPIYLDLNVLNIKSGNRMLEVCIWGEKWCGLCGDRGWLLKKLLQKSAEFICMYMPPL